MGNRRFENIWLKVSAALLSVILWAYIWGERKANNEISGEVIQREFSAIPIAVLKDPVSLFTVAMSHTEVSVVIEADKNIMEKIDRENITAYIDVRGLGTGAYQLPPAWNAPAGIKIVISSPEFVKVTVEDKRITEVKPIVESIKTPEVIKANP